MELRDGDLVATAVDRGRRRGDGRGLQRPGRRVLDPDDSASVHGGGCAGVHPRRGSRRTTRLSRSSSTDGWSGGIGLGVERTRLSRDDRVLDGGARTWPGHVHACPAAALTTALDELELQRARSRHRSRQRRVATRRREGRVPARGRPSRSPATPGRADSRLGDVLAATRRASRVTNRGRGRSSRLRARGDAARDRRAVGVS